MLTIRKKYGVVLGIVFGISIVSFNLFMDSFFYDRFKEYVSEDMMRNYEVSSKNIDDYILINDIDKNSIINENLIDNTIQFIVERVYCQGVLFDFNGKVLASGVTSKREIDVELLTKLPNSFALAKDNKIVLDIERKEGQVYGKLSCCVYGNEYKPLGILVLVKEYSEEFSRNSETKNLINIIVSILFIIIFIAVYLLSSRMVKPIINLKCKASQIAKGKYPERLQVTSNDEIGILVNTFNIMSEKLRLKDEQEKSIFRNITHELKTPLASISGYAQILRTDDFNDEEFRKKALDRIVSESDRMHDQVVTLLDISKQSSDLEDFSFEQVNIKEVIKEIISVQLPNIKEKELAIIEQYEEVIINGNRQYLIILFSNLIDNGVKYSNRRSDMLLKLEEEKSSIRFSIYTEGKAIPTEMKEKIFEPFVKVEKGGFSSKTSHGLGLYMCKNIVVAHNGKIELNVNKNISEFIVKIPNFTL